MEEVLVRKSLVFLTSMALGCTTAEAKQKLDGLSNTNDCEVESQYYGMKIGDWAPNIQVKEKELM